MHRTTLPSDTSGGEFNSLRDVGEQDGAISGHWPVLKNQFDLLSDTVKLNEEDAVSDRADWQDSVRQLKEVFEKIIEDEKSDSTWNPFD